ncbi:MAG: polyphosphate kinase 1 [Brevinematales bacterium]|nr:polyphosphate kinase 1 [Brevinematales bacterium]
MIDLNSPQYFLNREWSWLEFNNRVLHEACEEDRPVMERLKFLSIVTRNLEEFFMVRVAAINKQNDLESDGSSADGLTPAEQLKGIIKRTREFYKRLYGEFDEKILPELHQAGVKIVTEPAGLKKYQDYLKHVFQTKIQKVLTPLSVGPTHPFPRLNSGRLYIAAGLKRGAEIPDSIEVTDLSFVEVPASALGRYIKIEDEETYFPLESVIKMFIGDLYHGYSVEWTCIIRLSRDTDFNVETDAASDLLMRIEEKIKTMHLRDVVKFEYEKGLPETRLKELVERFDVVGDAVFEIDSLFDLGSLMEIYMNSSRNDLKEPQIKPLYPMEFQSKDLFEVIGEKDVLLFHPYQSYDPVVELIEKAAEDPEVLAIKLTLYRTSSKSAILKGLIKAAINGKYVTILEELKARGDEERNISAARALEDAGAHVIYGIANLKTHTKALMIVRKERNGIRRYCHLATGNYNETTAKLYSDFSLFTSDELIGEDISQLFNLLTGFSLPNKWNHVAVAPIDLREKFLSLIRRETENAKNRMNARIIAKLNTLLDKEIVQALYEASMAGVKISLIVRGACALKPGLKGISENITIHSIIGRFLEHARIYYFYNGGDEEYFLSSADWMMRNLNRRVELLFPIKAKDGRAILSKVLDIQFSDTANTWILNSDGNYVLRMDKKPRDSFKEIEEYIVKKEEKARRDMEKKLEFKPIRNPEKGL